MDDLVIFDVNKNRLKELFLIISNQIEKYKLKINKKSRVYELNKGISFLGYTFFVNNNTLWIKFHNKTIRRINGKLKKLKSNDYTNYYRSISSYNGYFKNSNTSYYYLCLRREVGSMYNKYLELNKDFSDCIVLIKSGKFYRTYDNDAIIISYLFDYQLLDNRVGFPFESLFKVKARLKSNNINYLILNGTDIDVYKCDNNKYDDIYNKAYKKYELNSSIDELISEIRFKINNDISNYQVIKSFVDNL